MSSLVLYYRESIEVVAEMWNAHAESLGFQTLRPLQPGINGWDILSGGDGGKLFVGLYRHCDGLTRLLFEPGLGLEEQFWACLELPLPPLEVFLCDHTWEFASHYLICDSVDCSPDELVEGIEAGWAMWGVRTLQAVHNDLLSPLEEWKRAIRERGYFLRAQGLHQILDVHWNDNVPPPETQTP